MKHDVEIDQLHQMFPAKSAVNILWKTREATIVYLPPERPAFTALPRKSPAQTPNRQSRPAREAALINCGDDRTHRS